MNDPEHVHFVADGFGLRLGHQKVEQGPIAMRLKFVAVRVVEKFQPLFGKRLAGAVEDRGRRAAALFVEGVLVRDPGAADVLQA